MRIKIITRISYFIMLLTSALSSVSTIAMIPLSDDELSDVTGQALLMMDMREGEGVSKDLNFYRAGLDAIVELNANFEKLQLGCGGVNGPGCDIDIDHMSLSGPDNCPGGRPGCDAILTRPFFEFAIKDDGTPHREIVGFRLSAESAFGVLTAGDNTSEPNGIKSLSGYMITEPISGTAKTQAVNLGCNMPNQTSCTGGMKDPNATILQFSTHPKILACTSGCYSGNKGTSNPGQSKGVYIPALSVPFTGPGAVVNGNRLNSTSVVATGNVPDVMLDGGQLHVTMDKTIAVLFFITVSEATVNLKGSASGLKTEINFKQDLGFIHKINVNSPFSLSLQQEPVWWPGAANADISLPGWWMSFKDPVDLGELNPVEEISIVPTFDQMAIAFRDYFTSKPIEIGTNAGLQQLFNGEMTVDVGKLNIPSTLYMSVSDLQLGASQNVIGNCWGNARFC